jgi:hypothetical protein
MAMRRDSLPGTWVSLNLKHIIACLAHVGNGEEWALGKSKLKTGACLPCARAAMVRMRDSFPGAWASLNFKRIFVCLVHVGNGKEGGGLLYLI